MSENSKKKQGAKEILIVVIIAIIIAVLIKSFIIDSRVIPTSSMVPTIEVNDRVIMWRLAYSFDNEPSRGDIIVFEAPVELNQPTDLIKRIIGLPGETVEIKNSLVYINDEPLSEDYLNALPNYVYEKVTVPENSYFIMGDNRNNSVDSHLWQNPFLLEENIKGKAIFIYWPISRIEGI
jgi:signal peptidase I